MKKYVLFFAVILTLLLTDISFANSSNISRRKLPEPYSQTLLGKNVDFRDFLAGLSVTSPLQRTFFNLGLFYEKTQFFYDRGIYGVGLFANAEIGLVKYRASLFAKSKISIERENHEAGFENLETGLKIVLLRAFNDSYSFSTHLSAQFVERSDTTYVPDNFYNLGASFSWGVPFVIAFREMLVFGSDLENFTKYLTRTEFEFSREKVSFFGRTSLILAFEFEYIHIPDEKNKNHYELSFTLFNISGIYYTLAWRFGTGDDYIYHNRLGIMIKF